ncbi:MAG TPA: hypothetical protein VI790_05065 [Candidatus Nanoarchaeia archaeon]|nr:hypothetical protein [Candidatus Nanoarchaeia archaeon]
MAGITDLLSNLPGVISLMERIFFIMTCLFLGSFSWNGWKRYKNWGLSVIATLLLGYIILASSIALGQIITIRVPYIPYALHALISSTVLYLVLRLFSGDAKIIGKYVTGEAFKKIEQEFNKLKEEYARLVKTLEKKNIMPEPLSAKELDEELGKRLKDSGYTEYAINSKEVTGNLKQFNLTIKKKEYKAVLDVYTGELLEFIKTNLKPADYLKILAKNKKILTGVIIAAVFTFIVTSQLNNETINEISLMSQTSLTPIDTTFTNYQLANTTCLNANDLLYIIKTEQFTNYLEGQPVPNEVKNAYPNEYYTNSTRITYNGSNYYLTLSRTISEPEFNNALQTYLQQNMLSIVQGGVDICKATYNAKTLSNYLKVCVSKQGSLCDCKTLKEASGYCEIISQEINDQISSQLGGLTSQLGGLAGLIT